jgi:hypothetical protein
MHSDMRGTTSGRQAASAAGASTASRSSSRQLPTCPGERRGAQRDTGASRHCNLTVGAKHSSGAACKCAGPTGTLSALRSPAGACKLSRANHKPSQTQRPRPRGSGGTQHAALWSCQSVRAGSARALVCQAQEGAMPSSRAATTAGTLRGCRCAANAAVAPPAASRTLAACARGLADYTGCASRGGAADGARWWLPHC